MPHASTPALTITIAAAVLSDERGRYLFLRKHGAKAFMQAGGKIDAGETAAQALVRELEEELGLTLQESDLEHLGHFSDSAANEPGHTVEAEIFRGPVIAADSVAAQAEIAEARWVDPEEILGLTLAPLSRQLFTTVIPVA